MNNQLPEITEADRQFLRNNDSFDDTLNWIRGYAQRAVDAAAPSPNLLKEYAAALCNPYGVAVFISAHKQDEKPDEERVKYLRHLGRFYTKLTPDVWPKWLKECFDENSSSAG